MWRGLIDAYRDRLPVTDATPVELVMTVRLRASCDRLRATS